MSKLELKAKGRDRKEEVGWGSLCRVADEQSVNMLMDEPLKV